MNYKSIAAFIFVIALSICHISCQTDGKEMNKPKDDKKEMSDIERNLREGITPTDEEKSANLKAQRSHAKALIQKRSEEEPAYSMLTAYWWQCEFVHDGKGMSKTGEYAGHWLRFNDDFTYTYGVYDEQKGSGQYHLKLDGLQLMMIDNKNSKMPEEWTLMTKEDVMVMVGRNYFSNNPKQIKYTQAFEQPQKS